MIRSSVSPILLALAVLSVSPSLAAPQGRPAHGSHWPYKDYDSSEHLHRRQNTDVPAFVAPCMLSPGELPPSWDKEFISRGTRFSQTCTESLGFMLVPQERALCRSKCLTCASSRGYDMSCVSERVVQRSSETDLTQLEDLDQPINRMTPTNPTDCVVSPEEALQVPYHANWTPLTFARANAFDNECLTRYYLNHLSVVGSCSPDDNACMIDQALERVEDAASNVPLDGVPSSSAPLDAVPLDEGIPDDSVLDIDDLPLEDNPGDDIPEINIVDFIPDVDV